VFYKTAEPADGVTPTGQVLFLLHGAAFQAKTWQIEVPTIQTMASVGHKVIAVDLPGA
jgi:pimeloyl-ACP methyl ester carboxylesterase